MAAVERLKNHEPVQHVVGFTYFLDRKFKVTSDTLIPRPETEELVMLIVDHYKKRTDPIKVLDIGAGSGCITISLDLLLPNANVMGWDISEAALRVCQENATNLASEADFQLKDALTDSPTEKLDLIVSNPPYIPEMERNTMHKNVTAYDPHLALFVPDNDPLLFYRSIAEMAKNHLFPLGKLFFEIHEQYGDETKSLLEQLGFEQVEIHQDLQGKERIVVATNPQQP